MKQSSVTRDRSSQRGATLIEALVSLLVMSFALMGLAGLQLSALAFQKSAWSAHRVAEITGDFAERVRANPKAVDADYQYVENYATGKAAAPTLRGCRGTAVCTPSQVAADDLAELLMKAQALLPQGSMQVTGTVADGFVFTSMYLDKDNLATDGSLKPALVCQASTTGLDLRNCCPSTASAPDGLRCRRFTIVP